MTLLALIGTALVSGGDINAGRDTLLLASSSEGWNPTRFMAVGDGLLTAGDTTGAFVAYARAAIDPVMGTVQRDSITRIADAVMGGVAWQGLLGEAQDELTTRIRNIRLEQPLSRDIRLATTDGRAISAHSAFSSQISVVPYWVNIYPDMEASLSELELVSSRLESANVGIHAVTRDPHRERLPAIKRGLPDGVDLLVDADRSLADALSNWTGARYYVIENGRTLRYAGELEMAARVAITLSENRTP